MHRTLIALSAAGLLVLSLGGCGYTTKDRALSGAGIGAAGGALIGGATGGSVVGGALIGGAAGAAAGAMTDKDDVNLGKPWWRR